MHAMIDFALSRARTVILTLLLLLVGGLYAYVAIPKESDPDINIPIIYVSLHLEGVSPDDSERLLIRPMEQELASIEGVKEMRSTAYQGGGNVVLEFQAGFDSDTALDDVRNKVDEAKSELPAEADEPTVNEVNFSLFPVLVVTLSGDVPERTLLRLARRLHDEIETLSPVLEAGIAGDREEQVEIVLDESLIESYGLNGNDILQAFDRNNQLVAAGNLDTGVGKFAIEVPGLFETTVDIMSMPVKVSGDSFAVILRMLKVSPASMGSLPWPWKSSSARAKMSSTRSMRSRPWLSKSAAHGPMPSRSAIARIDHKIFAPCCWICKIISSQRSCW